MKGKIISEEFNKKVWVQDNKGAEYVCHIDQHRDVKRKEDLSQDEQKSCMNLNAAISDSW